MDCHPRTYLLGPFVSFHFLSSPQAFQHEGKILLWLRTEFLHILQRYFSAGLFALYPVALMRQQQCHIWYDVMTHTLYEQGSNQQPTTTNKIKGRFTLFYLLLRVSAIFRKKQY